MKRQRFRVIAGIVLGGAMLAGCGSWSVREQRTELADVDLAGVWEYEENHMVYTLKLDARGNGTYDWQDGRFETWSIADGMWRGAWFQPRNDREGEFALTLSHDHRTATGRWWYTRIGSDTAPTQPGGEFTLRRMERLEDDPIDDEESAFEWASDLESESSLGP